MLLSAKTNDLLLDPRDGWLTIWLNRPEARNALSSRMISELTQTLAAVSGDASVRGVTLRGKGGVFCAGGDLKGFKALLDGGTPDHDALAAASRQAGELFGLLDRLPLVVVMLVEGAAMAGGLGMICAADVVAVTADAKFALTETTLGIPPAQIAPFVVQRLGLKTARRLMLTAARFDASEAINIGLADFVAADAGELDVIELKIRESVLRCAPNANAVTKDIVLAAARLGRDAMLDKAAEGFARCMAGGEAREGIAAFFEKRAPSWVPRK